MFQSISLIFTPIVKEWIKQILWSNWSWNEQFVESIKERSFRNDIICIALESVLKKWWYLINAVQNIK